MENASNTLDTLYEEKVRMLEIEQYTEANNLQKKITEYRESIILSQRREMQANQIREKREFEEFVMKEIESFNNEWDQREKEKLLELNKQLETLDVFQKSEIQIIVEEYEANYKERVPRQYLEMKKVQYELVRQERYIEAKVIKKRAEVIYKEENEKGLNQWKIQMKIKIDNKLLKQKLIRDQIEKDIKSKMSLLRTEKEREYNTMMLRFHSKKLILDYQQKTEIKREQTSLSRTLRKKRDHSQVSTRNSLTLQIDKGRTTQ